MATYWVTPANKRYDTAAAFAELGEIDWELRIDRKVETGDIMFIYGSSPTSALTHMCLVTDAYVSPEDYIEDSKFWRDGSVEELGAKRFMRLLLVKAFTSKEQESLSLSALKSHGFGSPQGIQRLKENTLQYVLETSSLTGSSAGLLSTDEDLLQTLQAKEIERSYRETLVRTRIHQRAFRDLIFSLSPHPACAVCGISELAVLDAAHIVPDSLGGKANADNGVVLCANHHRAFDRNLLYYENSEFKWVSPDSSF